MKHAIAITPMVPFIKRKESWDDYHKREENPVVGKCTKCGQELHKNSYMSCPSDGCPVQPKPVLN